MTAMQAYTDAYRRASDLGLPEVKCVELARSARERATKRVLALSALDSRQQSDLVGDSVNDTRRALEAAARQRWEGLHAWVRDFGASYVVFEIFGESVADERLVRVSYAMSGGTVTLGDEETSVVEQQSTTYVEAASDVRERAFVIQQDGRVFLTARARTEKADAIGNPGYMYITGRFVGGEKANSNNAFWSADDLAFGAPTVSYGPLNWLHNDKQIVGAIADSKLITPSPVETAEALAEPYIAAASVFWKFLYPQQAAVVEQANADEKLWYSMECVSKTVACMDHECGEWSYLDYMSKLGCQHVTERSGRLHFKSPIFLGGALIVPPVNPGWANADARIVERAAEQAFDQSRPRDVADEDWLKVVSGVMEYARQG